MSQHPTDVPVSKRGENLLREPLPWLVIGAILICVCPYFSWGGLHQGTKAKVQAATTQIEQFREAVELYVRDNGAPPSTAQGLDALIQRPEKEPGPKYWKKYLEDLNEIPKDPWGHPYIYRVPGPNGEACSITSYGPDGKDGGGDDIASVKGPERGVTTMRREFSLSRLFWRLLGMAGMLILMLTVVGTGVAATQWFAGTASSPGSLARRACAETQMDLFKTAIQVYAKDKGRPPSTEQGLDALIHTPAPVPRPTHWTTDFDDVTEIPKDPWGNDYHYQSPGPHGEAFLITSYGADGRPGGTGWNRDSTSGPTDGPRNGDRH